LTSANKYDIMGYKYKGSALTLPIVRIGRLKGGRLRGIKLSKRR